MKWQKRYKNHAVAVWLWVFMLILGFQSAQASQVKWLSSKAISNMTETLAEAKTKIKYTKAFSDEKLSGTVVAFPKKIPFYNKPSYSHFIILKSGSDYAIEVANSTACNLSKTCVLGSLIFQGQANPTIYYDRENREATSRVILHQGIHGYYTPGLAMADFWPAKLEWRYREVLYTLTWSNLDDKQAFVIMANSIIDQLSGLRKL